MPVRETIGVVGGSGLYDLPGLTDVRRETLQTPFGPPSDVYVVGRLGDVELVFLPRHARGHRLLPQEINFRANMWGLKALGVQTVISVSAVGSMKEHIRPGDLVIIDQFIDRTHGRIGTFFGEGVVAHVAFADPICARQAARLFTCAQAAVQAAGKGATVHQGGTYIVINGPQFSTRAESKLYRSWGVDVIGMTNLPEARLAREAGLCYATVALATDYDCWHESEDEVSVAAVMAVVAQNVKTAKDLVVRAAASPLPAPTCGCADAVKHAVMTDPSLIPAAARERLALILHDAPPPK